MASNAQPIRIHAVIPAAGQSRRMGRPKQLMRVGRRTMAAAVADALLEAGAANIVVVTRTDVLDALNLPSDPRVQTALNDDPDTEMLDSIRIGIDRLKNPPHASASAPACATMPDPDDGLLVIPVDMPAVSAETHRACIAAFTADPERIIVATHGGRRGHPIILPIALTPDLNNLPEGLRSLLDRHPQRIKEVETKDPNITRDINTMEDYKTLDNE
jgi:CTP:molybdopterin cytidylyltransferase MocA